MLIDTPVLCLDWLTCPSSSSALVWSARVWTESETSCNLRPDLNSRRINSLLEASYEQTRTISSLKDGFFCIESKNGFNRQRQNNVKKDLHWSYHFLLYYYLFIIYHVLHACISCMWVSVLNIMLTDLVTLVSCSLSAAEDIKLHFLYCFILHFITRCVIGR